MQVCFKDLKANSNEEIEKYKEIFGMRQKLYHENIASPIEIRFKQEETYCGAYHKIQLLFEYHENDLEKDINQRALNDSYYTEDELWDIAESIIKAMSYLQRNDINYGYLTPKSIFISAADPTDPNSNPIYKIFVYFLNNQDRTTYFQILSE